MARCIVCGVDIPNATYGRVRCDEHKRWRKDPPDSLVSHTTRFEDDPWAVEIARRGGATLEIVGEALGLTRERARQIEEIALRKLVPRLKLVGVDASDIARILAERPGSEFHEGTAGYVDMPPRERQRLRNKRWMEKRRAHPELPEAEPERLEDGPWSELGLRLDAASKAAEVAAVRAYLASHVKAGTEPDCGNGELSESEAITQSPRLVARPDTRALQQRSA